MPSDHKWKVVPICGDQQRDVREEDLIFVDGDPLFRKCSTYRGGGGYDLFPDIAHSRGLASHPDAVSEQFVVQLYGCNLDCPFCYVTRQGVWGGYVPVSTTQLVTMYRREAEGRVFHLMGGAPALQMKFWPELLRQLGSDVVFHSDLMLTERKYDPYILDVIDQPNVLLAVSIKGIREDTFRTNTRKSLDKDMLYHNLRLLMRKRNLWYYTFTNVPAEERNELLDVFHNDWFDINLIQYNAMPYVDNRNWAGVKLTDGV